MFLIVWLFSFFVEPVEAKTYYDTMKELLEEYMPGEAMLPTPYGADSRFRPKSIWVYLDEYEGNSKRPKKRSAWVIASSGDALYKGVSLATSPIDLPIRQSSKENKLAITASLSTNITDEKYQSLLELTSEEKIEFEIDLGEIQIEYVNYFDMLFAQTENKRIFDDINSLLKKRHNKDLPKRRVITAALKVNGAKIAIKKIGNGSISVKLNKLLNSIGFKFSSDSQSFDELELKGWRYIAYAARYTNKDGLISTAKPPGLDEDREANSSFQENYEW